MKIRSKKKETSRRLNISILLMTMLFTLLFSCKKNSKEETENGKMGAVAVSLKGGEFNDMKNIGTKASANTTVNSSVQIREFTLPNGFLVEAALSVAQPDASEKLKTSASSGSKAALETSPLDSEIRYKLVVYDDAGNYVTERDYARGQESSTAALTLEADRPYTFVAYSINSKTDLPNVTQDNLSTSALTGISGNNAIMYFRETRTLTAGGTNYLSIVLRHLFSQITASVDASLTGYNIMSINAGLDSHYPNADIKLSDTTIVRTGNSETKSIVFPDPGASGSATLVAEPTILNGSTTTGKLILSSITIGEISQSVPADALSGLAITPGVKYDLNLRITPADILLTHSGQQAARIRGIIWMRHNLGATTSLDPDQNPSVKGLHGNYYQWGRRAAIANADTQTGAISGWNSSNAPNGAWNSGTQAAPVKTNNDPCPSGYRVPTADEWRTTIASTNNFSEVRIGTGQSSSTNYTSAFVLTSKRNRNVKLTFPIPGHRNASNGILQSRGGGTHYWSLTENTATSAWSRNANGNMVAGNGRAFGFPVRCVAQ